MKTQEESMFTYRIRVTGNVYAGWREVKASNVHTAIKGALMTVDGRPVTLKQLQAMTVEVQRTN